MRSMLVGSFVAALTLAAALAGSCAVGDLSALRECIKDDLPYGETLYYGNDAYHEQISRDRVLEVVDACYDGQMDSGDEPGYGR